MWKEFRELAVKGNVLDMAIGIIIGAAFGTIVRSLVDDVIMPPIGMLLGNVDFTGLFILLKEGTQAPPPYNNIEAATAAGAVTLNYGRFINTILTFLIVSFSVFLLVKSVNKLKRSKEEAPAPEPTTKDCPYCYSKIPVKATRCPECTSQLNV